MQDSQKIPHFMQQLQKLWEICPDLRFSELIKLIKESKVEEIPDIPFEYAPDSTILRKIMQIQQEVDPKNVKIAPKEQNFTPFERIALSGY